MKPVKIVVFAFLLASMNVHAQIDSSFVVNVENEAVRKYMSEVCYTSIDDEEQIDKYNVAPPTRRDIPNAAVVKLPAVAADTLILVYSGNTDFTPSDTIGINAGSKDVEIYNLVPRKLCYYKVETVQNETSAAATPFIPEIICSGKIEVEGQLRMIYAPSVRNIRDIGGWPTADGKRIKYEKIYRGGELNGMYKADSIDIVRLKKLGIEAEIDMRAWYEDDNGVSAFGFLKASEVESGEVPTFYFSNDSGQLIEHLTQYMYLYRWRMEFQFIVNNLREGRPIYIHCRHGADRTGFLTMLLEGLLGVGYDGLVKDYLITLFNNGNNKKEIADGIVSFINDLEGNTLQEKFNYYFVKKIGVKQSDIDYFLSEMLEDAPSSTTGVGLPASSRLAGIAEGIYDLKGVKTGSTVNNNHHGILLKVGSDGSVRKIMR